VELVPQLLFAGALLSPPPTLESDQATRERMNLIWQDVVSRYPYQVLQVTAFGAQFIGAKLDDSVAIELPVVQVRSPVSGDLEGVARKAQDIFDIVGAHFGDARLINPGLRLISHVPAGPRGARQFLLHQVLSKTEDELAGLASSERFSAGLKLYVQTPDDGFRQLQLEPLLADDEYLFVDLDLQLPGEAKASWVTFQSEESMNFLRKSVIPYLDERSVVPE